MTGGSYYALTNRAEVRLFIQVRICRLVVCISLSLQGVTIYVLKQNTDENLGVHCQRTAGLGSKLGVMVVCSYLFTIVSEA